MAHRRKAKGTGRRARGSEKARKLIAERIGRFREQGLC